VLVQGGIIGYDPVYTGAFVVERSSEDLTFQRQNISLGLWDTKQQSITTSRSYYFTTTNYVYVPDVVRLGVGYRFTKLKKESKLPKC